tara:strand:+ start:2664 stop:3224 length:561 start_codon:yes stop_codon:yes gene_type:complete
MANKVYEIYKDLPSWAKGVVVIGGIAIVYFTTKSFLKKIKDSATQKKAMEVVVEQKKEIKDLETTGLIATFKDSQYKAWADALQNQFDGCDFNISDWVSPILAIWNYYNYSNSGKKLVMIIAKFKNDLDFLKLSTAWGIRTYDQCGWGMGNVENATLSKAVSDELNNGEISKINDALSKQGIKYRF